MHLRLPHAGNQLMISNDEEDLEQLIKGGPFELGLYADKLSSHMFGTESVAQVSGACSAHSWPSCSVCMLCCQAASFQLDTQTNS